MALMALILFNSTRRKDCKPDQVREPIGRTQRQEQLSIGKTVLGKPRDKLTFSCFGTFPTIWVALHVTQHMCLLAKDMSTKSRRVTTHSSIKWILM